MRMTAAEFMDWPGKAITLLGMSGVGKTTLARAVLVAAGHEGEVPSPSYNILETYPHSDSQAVTSSMTLLALNLLDVTRLAMPH